MGSNGRDNFDPQDGDLLDFLSNFKCYTKVTSGNISRVIHELAHQEFLQKPTIPDKKSETLLHPIPPSNVVCPASTKNWHAFAPNNQLCVVGTGCFTYLCRGL